jgi:hypothetical protein
VFREDPEYEAHEAQYRAILKELLGDDDDDEEEGGNGEGSGESSVLFGSGLIAPGACWMVLARCVGVSVRCWCWRSSCVG